MMCKYANLRDVRICGFDTESVSVTHKLTCITHGLIYVTPKHKSHLPPRYSGGYSPSIWETTTLQEKGGGCVVFFVAADIITGGIMRDQYARREDDRKGRMDPMSRSS